LGKKTVFGCSPLQIEPFKSSKQAGVCQTAKGRKNLTGFPLSQKRVLQNGGGREKAVISASESEKGPLGEARLNGRRKRGTQRPKKNFQWGKKATMVFTKGKKGG